MKGYGSLALMAAFETEDLSWTKLLVGKADATSFCKSWQVEDLKIDDCGFPLDEFFEATPLGYAIHRGGPHSQAQVRYLLEHYVNRHGVVLYLPDGNEDLRIGKTALLLAIENANIS